jgi:tyrosyl-tRNA synthetase
MDDERLERVTRHTAEVVTEDELATVLEGEDPSVYIGYAPTGEMHIGHFTTIRKLVDFLDADLDVTVLIADLHAHLDDEKSPFELLDARSEYYRVAIEGMVEAAGGDPDAISFVRGTDFELEEPYTLEVFRMAAETTATRARRAASEVIRQSESPSLGGLLYPLMQTQDVAALDADIAYGGLDQRGIYMLSREVLPKRGYDKPVCCFAPLLSGLTGEKMSASEAASTIAVTDEAATVREKIDGAYCPAGEREENGVLEYLEYLIFPILERTGGTLGIERPEEYGGDLHYDAYGPLEADFLEGELHPADLKPAAGEAIVDAIAPIRERVLERPDVLAAAYPDRYE